jgi:NAD(P)-dependent dehydrogenase (short-subunit alcohol dehydrogenase family)
VTDRWRHLEVADQWGRRAIVTGANTGLGYVSTLALVTAGAEVVMAVRDLDRGQAAAQRIREQVPDAKLRVIHLDLAEPVSVRDFAAGLVEEPEPVDILMNNAGVMLVPRREITTGGFERQMGVNHLGHFALTVGLLPALRRSAAGARVVSVTSLTYARVGPLDLGLGLTGDYTPMRAYGQSKLAVALFGQELHRRATAVGTAAGPALVSVLAHPGWSATAETQPDDGAGRSVRFARRATAVLGSSPVQGARAQLYAATAPELTGGEFIGPSKLGRGAPVAATLSGVATDTDAARWLWDESVRLTGADPNLPASQLS